MMSAASVTSSLSRESLEELFRGASGPTEDLPMLRSAIEQTAAVCGEELSRLCAAGAQLTLESIASGSPGDLLAAHEQASIVGVLQAPKWETRVLVSANRDLIYAVVEMLLGSDISEPVTAPEREFTKLERRLGGLFIELFANALTACFAPIAEASFLLERTTDGVDFDVLGRRDAPVTVAKLQLVAPGRAGELLLAIPQSALQSQRKALSRVPPKEPVKVDSLWAQQMREEVTRASVTLSAILDQRKGMLGDIANLRVGQILELNATKDSLVRVECNGERLIWCHLGKANGVYTLRVDGPINREQEFVEELLSQ